MRILAHWNRGGMRFSVLRHDMNFTLKIEDGELEQNYKLFDSLAATELHKYESLLSSDSLVESYLRHFSEMKQTLQMLHAGLGPAADEFDVII